jgi:23S rRNA (adenine2503-C2)-methyltransferase
MGMGDAGKNVDSVCEAVRCLVDRDRFCFAQSKVTVSTVGPTPEIFQRFADVPCTIAWSLHAADDGLRRRLVPTTKHTTVQLRDGLLTALSSRSTFKQRTIMIAVTLISGVNDRSEVIYI